MSNADTNFFIKYLGTSGARIIFQPQIGVRHPKFIKVKFEDRIVSYCHFLHNLHAIS